jgi:hypothetical protein
MEVKMIFAIIILCSIILLVPIYLLFLFILGKKNIGNKNKRKYIALIPTVIISPIMYIVVIFLWLTIISYYPKEKFDTIKWHENIEERYKMSENIIKEKILIGKTREEVIEILGSDFYERGMDNIGYYLGFIPQLYNIDPDVLIIYFENGIVIKVEQINT